MVATYLAINDSNKLRRNGSNIMDYWINKLGNPIEFDNNLDIDEV